jgi:hypothetical protein
VDPCLLGTASVIYPHLWQRGLGQGARPYASAGATCRAAYARSGLAAAGFYAPTDLDAMRKALDSSEWDDLWEVVATRLLRAACISILFRLFDVVGVAGFEPTAPRSQSECATKLRHTPCTE